MQNAQKIVARIKITTPYFTLYKQLLMGLFTKFNLFDILHPDESVSVHVVDAERVVDLDLSKKKLKHKSTMYVYLR